MMNQELFSKTEVSKNCVSHVGSCDYRGIQISKHPTPTPRVLSRREDWIPQYGGLATCVDLVIAGMDTPKYGETLHDT